MTNHSARFAFGLLLLASAPPRAAACGCLSPPMLPNPPPMPPVVQAGERILFSVDGGEVIAHIQIAYTGNDPTEFGWIVPVPSIPKLEVGSDDLFTALGEKTGPLYTFTARSTCQVVNASPQGAECGCGGVASKRGVDDPFVDTQDSRTNPVVLTGTVGPFAYAVLKADVKQPLVDWLALNKFGVPTMAAFDPYIGPGLYFLALKLQSGKASGDIKPVVVRYRSDLPMIPITLTAATTTPTLPILVWVLGPARAIPRNYMHSVLASAALDWLDGVRNYQAVVTRAAAEAPRQQTFFTEYAGPASIMKGAVPAELASLFDEKRTLTRLFTVLGAAAMTRDPVFGFNPDLPDVPLRHTALAVTDCGLDGVLDTEEGFHVPISAGALRIPANLPASLRVEMLREAGPPEVVVDNDEAIRAILAGMAPPSRVDLGAGDGSAGDDGGISWNAPGHRGRGDLWLFLGVPALVGALRLGGRKRGRATA